jgi:hypothetical protein
MLKECDKKLLGARLKLQCDAFKPLYVEYKLGSNANNSKQAPAECRSFGVEFQ